MNRFAWYFMLLSSWQSPSFSFELHVAVSKQRPEESLLSARDSLDDFSSEEPAETTTILEYDDFLPNPNPSMEPRDVLSACMNTLLDRQDAGLEVCFNFSSDRCRAALGGSLERFAEYATNPVFGYLVQCCDYEIINVGPVIKGTPTRGDMQTILMEAKQNDETGDDFARRFLWTFQKERRPPRQNCWVVHEVIYVKNAFQLTI